MGCSLARKANEMPEGFHPETLAGVLSWLERSSAERVCVLTEAADETLQHYTFGALVERAHRSAQFLTELGLAPGDRFHIHLPNSIAFLEALFGAALIGAVVVPTNPRSSLDELAYMLSHSGAVASLISPEFLPQVSELQWLAPDLRHIVVTSPETRATEPHIHWESALLDSRPILGDFNPAPGQPAVILYTSGTTGWPKGVLISQGSLLKAGLVISQWLRIRPEDRWLVTLPLFHGNSLFYATMSALVSGASIALVDGFTSAKWSHQAAQYECTLTSLFAAQLRMLLREEPVATDSKHLLRTVIFAQGLTARDLSTFEERFRVELLQFYGMTETVAPVVTNPLYGHKNNLTMGRVPPWSSVRIVDSMGNDAKPGETGELIVGGTPGKDYMIDYFGNTEATKRTIVHNWLHTGDFVRVDTMGYIEFIGRTDELVKPSVEVISTLEIERVVEDNWAVHECAAVPAADPIHDAVIELYVVRIPASDVTAEEIFEWCQMHLADSKFPTAVYFIDELPRTAVGKVDKQRLRQLRNPGSR